MTQDLPGRDLSIINATYLIVKDGKEGDSKGIIVGVNGHNTNLMI